MTDQIPNQLTEEQFNALPEHEKFELVFNSMQDVIMNLLGQVTTHQAAMEGMLHRIVELEKHCRLT